MEKKQQRQEQDLKRPESPIPLQDRPGVEKRVGTHRRSLYIEEELWEDLISYCRTMHCFPAHVVNGLLEDFLRERKQCGIL